MKCHICKIAESENPVFGPCASCKPISRICFTSAEDGIRYGIPGANLADLQRALAYERRKNPRTTLVKALERAIRKFEVKP